MEKQLCINRISLPDELLSVIKDFAFYDTVSYGALSRKKTIHTLIQCTRWSYRNKNYNRYIFWIEEDVRCRQFQMTFCEKCGNYTNNQTYNQTPNFEKIMCKCV